jgi:hypothetical protein
MGNGIGGIEKREPHRDERRAIYYTQLDREAQVSDVDKFRVFEH